MKITQPFITIFLVSKVEYTKRLSSGVSLLNRNNFKELFPFVYFDLSALKDDQTKLTFHYELNNERTVHYTIYAIVLHEKRVII